LRFSVRDHAKAEYARRLSISAWVRRTATANFETGIATHAAIVQSLTLEDI